MFDPDACGRLGLQSPRPPGFLRHLLRGTLWWGYDVMNKKRYDFTALCAQK
jgi:hypothetical protein